MFHFYKPRLDQGERERALLRSPRGGFLKGAFLNNKLIAYSLTFAAASTGFWFWNLEIIIFLRLNFCRLVLSLYSENKDKKNFKMIIFGPHNIFKVYNFTPPLVVHGVGNGSIMALLHYYTLVSHRCLKSGKNSTLTTFLILFSMMKSNLLKKFYSVHKYLLD